MCLMSTLSLCHPSSFRVAVFIPPGRCTKKNLHKRPRAPDNIHLKPQHVTTRSSTKNTGHPQHFWGWQHSILFWLCCFLKLQPQQKYLLFSVCCRNNHHINHSLLRFKCHILLFTFIPVPQYFPTGPEARTGPKLFSRSSKQQKQLS